MNSIKINKTATLVGLAFWTSSILASSLRCGELSYIAQNIGENQPALPAFVSRAVIDGVEIENKIEIIPLNEAVDKVLSSKAAGVQICAKGRAATSGLQKFFAFSVE